MTAAKDYKVGYGRPPEHSRFKPGQSGNPRGRPRKHRNFRTVLEDALQTPIDVSVNGHPRRMKRIDALVMTTLERALKNDPKATSALLAMMRLAGVMGGPTEVEENVDLAADQAELEQIGLRFLQRRGLEPPASPPAARRRPRARRKLKGGRK